MANYTTITSDKSKRTALILCVCGGFIGIHDYYLGKIGSGLVKTCTANFFCLGWIKDLIQIAVGSYKDNAGAPIRQ